MHKICYIGIGHICVALGFVGIFVPGLPTTPFLLLALWAFTKSSPALRDKLLNHPRFGQMLQNWQSHGVIPVRGKFLSGFFMGLSVLWCFHKSSNLLWPSIMAVCLACVFAYIVTRPSRLK